jgi:hypothetical protein
VCAFFVAALCVIFLLEQGRLPIETIAFDSGFGDRERMRRSFLRAYGQSPQSNSQGGGLARGNLTSRTSQCSRPLADFPMRPPLIMYLTSADDAVDGSSTGT